jgi:hypothetical protein
MNEPPMTVSLTCRHCNVEIEADDEDALVDAVQAHVGTHEREPPQMNRQHSLSRLQRQQRPHRPG